MYSILGLLFIAHDEDVLTSSLVPALDAWPSGAVLTTPRPAPPRLGELAQGAVQLPGRRLLVACGLGAPRVHLVLDQDRV